MSHTTEEFSSKLRLRLFPVHTSELPKFLSLNFMHIMIIFNFWLVHNMKDTLIVTAPESGAEAISFIKMWIVFPASILFVMFYTWISNRVPQSTLFRGIMLTFAAFFALFVFVLYPNQETLQMSPARIAELKLAYPHLQWFFPMVGYWIFTLFYTFSEFWSVIALTLLFWQFANQITPVEQAKRFYMLFGTFSAVGMLAAGLTTKGLSLLPDWNMIFSYQVGIVIVNIVIILFTYTYIDKHFVSEDQHYVRPKKRSWRRKKEIDPEDSKNIDKAKMKLKLSLWESFKLIITSRYLIYIAILGISYNISINMIEITWKSQLRILYPTKQEYNNFMGDFNLWLALGMTITGFIGVNVVRKTSWFVSAIMTPLFVLVTGALFFALTIFGEQCVQYLTLTICPITLACWIGLVQNLMTRCAKFSFFNSTREMAYIPLDAELKVKGKAAIDVLSGRVGKLGGSAIQQVLLILVPMSTQLTIAPYLAISVFLIIGAWIYAVKHLNILFEKLTQKK